MSGVYTVLADLVVVVHFTYLAVLVFGGVAAWRWPRLIGPHVAAVAWAAGAVTVRYDCPLTSLEEHLRERTGRGHAPDGFLRHYVRGVLFPERLTPLVVLVVAGLVVTGWVGLALRRRPGALRPAWTSGGRTPASGFPSPTRRTAGSGPTSRSRTTGTGSCPRS